MLQPHGLHPISASTIDRPSTTNDSVWLVQVLSSFTGLLWLLLATPRRRFDSCHTSNKVEVSVPHDLSIEHAYALMLTQKARLS